MAFHRPPAVLRADLPPQYLFAHFASPGWSRGKWTKIVLLRLCRGGGTLRYVYVATMSVWTQKKNTEESLQYWFESIPGRRNSALRAKESPTVGTRCTRWSNQRIYIETFKMKDWTSLSMRVDWLHAQHGIHSFVLKHCNSPHSRAELGFCCIFRTFNLDTYVLGQEKCHQN